MSDEVTLICFRENDPEHPHNWSTRMKIFIVCAGTSTVVNSTLGSSLPANAMSYMAPEFGISTMQGNPELVLPISIYLVGYVFAPLVFGPLSEVYGRKIVILSTFAGYTFFTLGCALAPNWPSMIVFRLFAGIFASAPLTVVGGLYADVYDDPVTRGRAIAVFMSAIVTAPIFAPILSGFISAISWRWTFWVALIIAGVSWIPLIFLPETYAPIILARRAAKIRKSEICNGSIGAQVQAPIEIEQGGWRHMFGVVLARPLRMMCTEFIVIATCMYLSIAYAIFYMFFQTYPLVFKGIYGMSSGISGLMFLPIGAGTGVGLVIFFLYDAFLSRSRQAGKTWTKKEESRRLPLACIGGPLFVVSLFWFGWTARPQIPWVVPFLAGIPFGAGNLLIFIALLNYLGDAYGTYAASAMAAAACCRSILGAVLPLATSQMYSRLGVDWATTLLAFLSLGMCAVPFLFIHFGDLIRERSAFCQMLKGSK